MAASTFLARLIHGNKRLQLDEEPYMLAQSFAPPAPNRYINYSSSGKRVSEKYSDRAWTFNLRIQGDTEAEVNGYIHGLGWFLENAADEQHPLQFEYYPYNATGAIPLWGQGVYRYTIREGVPTTTSPWLLRDKYATVSVACRLSPVVEGQRQRVALASGGIYEDTVKTPDGLSRGVQVCTAGTNLMTNPVFSHATWNTGWTGGSSIIATKITDANYPVFGDTCVKIQHNGGTAGTATYTQVPTLAATTYVVSSYVKLLDQRAPGTADMQFFCKGTALGAFNTIEAGDNWYRIWDTVTTGSGAGTVGLKLMQPGAACYMDGFQIELPSSMGTAPTPLMHGDALGCAWSSTRGASTTVRTVGALKLPVSAEIVNSANSSIRTAIRWNVSSSIYGETTTIFTGDASGTVTHGIECVFTGSDNTFNVRYGADSTLTSSAISFDVGDVSIIHLSWGKTTSGTDQIAMYINGSGTASNILNLATWGDDLYIGSLYDSTEITPATFLDFTIFDRYLTAAEVAADYAQVSTHVNGGDGLGQALSRIPYLWTKDGDGIVDSINDSTHDNFAVAAGIPGNLPANAVFDMRATFAGTADGGLVMANQTYKDYLDLTNLYNSTSGTQGVGTVFADFPASSGGGGTVITLTRQLDAYRGRKAYFLTTIADAGTTYCMGRMKITYDTPTNAYYSDAVPLATDGTAAWYLVGPMIIPDTLPSKYDWMAGFGELNFNMQLYRTSGSANIVVNSMMLMPGDFLYVPVSGLTTNHAIVIDDNRGYSYNSSTSKEDGFVSLYGQPIQLYPGVYNHLITVPAAIARDADFTDTATFNRVYVTPRYSLL